MHVSIVMPTFNRAYCIERAVRSVVAQTWQDWELLIVDDGSTDKTEELCQKFKAEIGDRFDYVKVPNGGASNARNVGIFRSSGQYIGFLDSDDYFYPEKLAMQISMMRRFDDVSFSFANWSTFFDGGEFGVSHHSMPATFSGNIYPSLLTVARNCIVTPSILVKRDALFQSGCFDTSMHICEDIDLWRRIARKGRALKIDTPLLGVHLRKSTDFPYLSSLEGRLRLYEKAWLEDPDLPRDFLVFLFVEILRCYAEVAEYRKEPEKAAPLRRALAAVEDNAASHTFPSLEAVMRRAIADIRVSAAGPKPQEAA